MDKTVQQKQRNDRHNRKLVRSTEHSWFGDLHSATAAATVTATNTAATTTTLGTPPLQSHNDADLVLADDEVVDTAASGTASTPPTNDNKTIRRLEFFTSLQKQLMSSLGRRSSSGSDTGNCAIKRNASCRVKAEKRDKLHSQKAAMPSSYSSASLAGANLTAQRASPTQPQPIPSGTGTNSTDHNQLSGITESLDQESNNYESSDVETVFKTCRLSPVTTAGQGRSGTNQVTASGNCNRNQIVNNDDTDPEAVDSAIILSRSVPNTLTLSPTNPFFSSIEQQLSSEQLIETGLVPKSAGCQQTNNNPFLYEPNTPVIMDGSGGSGTTSRVGSGDSGIGSNVTDSSTGCVVGTNVKYSKNSSQAARVQAVTVSPSCSKREEFLKATMKICLVVSPPSNKLQVSFHFDVFEYVFQSHDNPYCKSALDTCVCFC